MKLRARSRLGKYRVVRHLETGGCSEIYEAFDTLEQRSVALKVALDGPSDELHQMLLREVRLNGKLEHPSILPVKNAEVIDGKLVIAYPLGIGSLAERLARRMAVSTAMAISKQLLEALDFAHARNVMHLDVKPENIIMFPDNVARLADFGLARYALGTIRASGSGTVGYMAQEQAMGKPSFRSDVFSAALVIYRMLAGTLPEWPIEWPPEGVAKLRRNVPREFTDFLKRGLAERAKGRFADATVMLTAFEALEPRVERFLATKARKRRAQNRRS